MSDDLLNLNCSPSQCSVLRPGQWAASLTKVDMEHKDLYPLG